jgi:hypothetical protein
MFSHPTTQGAGIESEQLGCAALPGNIPIGFA